MNGTYKRSRNHRALALSVLGCAYLAVAPFSAIAQGAGGKGVSVTVNPTTGYAVINSNTVGTPRGTNVGPSGGPPSVTVRPGGGLSQSLPAGIEITGVRENAQTLRGTLGAKINVGAGALKGAAVRCVTSFRCNLAMAATAAGFQAFLDGLDWVMDSSGEFSHTSLERPTDIPSSSPGSVTWLYANNYTTSQGCLVTYVRDGVTYTTLHCVGNTNVGCRATYQGHPLTALGGNYPNEICRYGGSNPPIEPSIVFSPVDRSDVADAIETSYVPDPSDWSWLTGGMDFSAPDVTIEVTDLPVLDGSNEPNFIEWSDGTSKGTYNEYTPTVTGNNTSKPEISVKDKQTETTYDNQGNPTGTSTSTTATPSSPSGGGAPAAEVPTDCEFMPTVCRFIDWFTEPDPSPDPDQEIRDLVQVYEDGGRQVDLGPSVGACPPPRTIALSFVPAVEVSFQPFCDLAAAVRYWLLAIASFGAAYLTVRSI